MKKLTVAVAALAFLAMGCSQNDTPALEGEPSPEATTPGSGVNVHETKTFTTEAFDVEIELDNFYFDPTFIKAPGGSTATIELHNEGDVPHTFTSPALEVDEEIAPGATKELEIKLGTETRYEWYCRFHKDSGMQGAFSLH